MLASDGDLPCAYRYMPEHSCKQTDLQSQQRLVAGAGQEPCGLQHPGRPEHGVQGLIHRDLKAGNLLLSGGIVKLGDFGISKLLAAHESAAQTMVGTPYYMSPEILQAKPFLLKMLRPHPGFGAQVALAYQSETERIRAGEGVRAED